MFTLTGLFLVLALGSVSGLVVVGGVGLCQRRQDLKGSNGGCVDVDVDAGLVILPVLNMSFLLLVLALLMLLLLLLLLLLMLVMLMLSLLWRVIAVITLSLL